MALNVTLDLPENFIDDIKSEAQSQRRSVADVLRELVLKNWQATPKLPIDVEMELDAMSNLSDEVLWLLARNTLPISEQDALARLNAAAKERGLDPEEQSLLDNLVEQYERMLIRRAQAAALLGKRGHDMSSPKVLHPL